MEDNAPVYSPKVAFKTESRRIITKQLDFSLGDLKESYRLNYNEEIGKLYVLGFVSVLKFGVTILFGVIFIVVFLGTICYAMVRNIDGYYAILSKIAFYFFIPFIMIAFEALLIYGNKVYWFVSGIMLIFFIPEFTLGILGYLKSMSQGNIK